MYGSASEDDIEVTWIAANRLMSFLKENHSDPFMSTCYAWGSFLSEGLYSSLK